MEAVLVIVGGEDDAPPQGKKKPLPLLWTGCASRCIRKHSRGDGLSSPSFYGRAAPAAASVSIVGTMACPRPASRAASSRRGTTRVVVLHGLDAKQDVAFLYHFSI